MHSWKKKLVVPQLASACTLTITSQVNAANYDTWGYHNNTTTDLVWPYDTDNDGVTDAGGIDPMGSNGNYVIYDGFVYYNSANGDFDTVFKGDTVNDTISVYYLGHDYANGPVNQIDINNSVIHGTITSGLPLGYYSITPAEVNTKDETVTPRTYNGYNLYNGITADFDYNQYNGDVFTLNVSNSTIGDDYEAFYFTDTYLGDDKSKLASETFYTALGVVVNLDVESNINITNNSRVTGIALSEDNTSNTTYASRYHQWDNNINVSSSTVTSGSQTPLKESNGFFGESAESSDYTSNGGESDVALSSSGNTGSNYPMKNNVNFDRSTLLSDVEFTSHWNNDGVFFCSTGHDGNGDGVLGTNNDWVDNAQNVDELNITLSGGSKWVGSASMNAEVIAPADMYDVAPNSLTPGTTIEANNWGRIIDNKVFQSSVFNVTLNNGSEWNTVSSSVIGTLAVNGDSRVNVTDSSLVSDTIGLTNGPSLNIGEGGLVATDHLTVDSYSTVSSTGSIGWNNYSSLCANIITVANGDVLDMNVNQFGTEAFRTDKLELTSGNVANHNGNAVSGMFDINSNDYVLSANLVNDHIWGTAQANYGYDVVAVNSNDHLTINGNGDVDNDIELDNSSVDNVVVAAGDYKVRIDNATGAGAIADYKDREIIYVNDVNGNVIFSATDKTGLGAYTYQAEQRGNTVVLQQTELADYANMALNTPSANTNIWNLEQDTVGTRLTDSRHDLTDSDGAWVSYFGGNFNGDNGTINYDQDVNDIIVGVDIRIDGNSAKWIVGAVAGFVKGDMNGCSGQVDQGSQTAYIYSSAHFAGNVFVDGGLSYSHFNNGLSATMSNGIYIDGSTNSDVWGFGLKAGYDFKLGDAGYVTPYGNVPGLFQPGDDYQLSNDMKVNGQSYDSMRYELGVDAGYTFTYSEDRALTPYFELAYVYDDSNNDNDVNGDSTDNDAEESVVRVGLGTQFSFTKNFGAYTDANYLDGGDVDQNWPTNVGAKCTW